MASFGTARLLLCFGMLAGTAGDYSFAGIRAHSRTWYPPASRRCWSRWGGVEGRAGAAACLAAAGAPRRTQPCFGSMSGVMTKVAIYGLIRVLFDLVGQPLWWWGSVLAVVGAVTAVVGVLYALMQDDMKKLLAYSTVENIGVIVIGLVWRWCSRRLACRPWRRSP